MPNKKYFIILAVSLISVLSVVSFSYFISNTRNDNNQKINIDNGTMQLSYTDCTNSSDCSDITGELKPGDSITKTFSVKNTGTLDASYRIVFKESHNTFVDDELLYNLRYKDSGDNITVGSVPNGNINNMLLTTESIKAGETKEYKLIITWKSIIEGNNESNIGATFNIKLGIENIEDKALPTLNKLQTLNSNIKLNKGEPNFSKAATTDEGVYRDLDDYGYTYYFRGAVENNYVKFAGFYWRIVRINGDGSIRLVYDGTMAHANDDSSTDRIAGYSRWNTRDASPAYVGYMFDKIYEYDSKSQESGWIFSNDIEFSNGTYKLKNTITANLTDSLNNNHYTCLSNNNQCKTVYYVYFKNDSNKLFYIELANGKNIYDAFDEMLGIDGTNVNKENSTIKINLDEWYKTNLESYSNYISDTELCNDRSIALNNWNPNDGNISGSWTLYFGSAIRRGANSPTFKCPNKNDRFTVTDLKDGNAALTYPVGAVTSDEELLDGNMAFGVRYYTFSPGYFVHSYFSNYIMIEKSIYAGFSNGVNSSGLRPVINLKSDIDIKGNGTMTNPFIVS